MPLLWRLYLLTAVFFLRIGNLDVGNLVRYVANPENGFVVGGGVQVGRSMRCLGAYMQFTIGKTDWPVPQGN